MKTCTHCHEDKDESLFGRDPKGRGGLCSQCKECVRRKRQAYHQTPAGRKTQHRHNTSPAGRSAKKRYAQTIRGRELKREYRKTAAGRAIVRRNNHSPAGLAAKRRYADSDKRKAALQRYAQSHPYNQETHLVHQKYALKKKYGMTVDDLNRMLAEQNGVCAICGEPEPPDKNGKIRPLAIDHDHETGRVRGLLCGRCNRTLGHVKERPELLFAMMGYLKTHKEATPPLKVAA